MELVELSTMLSSLGYDELFRIKDYSLETYCIYFEGLKVCADYLHELLDESLIEYRVQMLYSPAVFDYANNNLK